MLMRDERLATLRSAFDDATETLTISRDGKQVARGQLTTPLGRQLIEQFVAAYMKAELRGAPKIVQAPGHSFSDMAAKCVHIVNLASVREVERIVGRPVDPLRFRANLYLDGMEPWSEFAWLDREIGVGPTRLAVFARTQRCEATNVDPATGARDMAIPAHLMRAWGHQDFGIYAKVVTGGEIAIDAPVAGAAVGARHASFGPPSKANASVARRVVLLRLVALAARAPHGTAQEFGLLVRLLKAIPAPGIVAALGGWLLRAIGCLRAAFALPAIALLSALATIAAVVAIIEALAIAALIAAERPVMPIVVTVVAGCCRRAGLRGGCFHDVSAAALAARTPGGKPSSAASLPSSSPNSSAPSPISPGARMRWPLPFMPSPCGLSCSR